MSGGQVEAELPIKLSNSKRIGKTFRRVKPAGFCYHLRHGPPRFSEDNTCGRRRPPQPANIVLIYCDDLGYGDLGCYGSNIRTPNLDRMASEGIRFTHFYSGNPVCSPSPAALMTGRYPTRVGVPRVLFPRDTTGLPDSEMTMAQVLKQKNYKTMCVGKWHLGHLPPYLPTSRGFDEYFGIPYSNDMDPRVLLHNTETIEQQATLETLTPRYTEHAVRSELNRVAIDVETRICCRTSMSG